MAAPTETLLVVAQDSVTLPVAGVANKLDPRDNASRDFVETQGYDAQGLPCSELNYILNNLGLWVSYITTEQVPAKLSIDQNLADVASPSTSFDNIKQAATETYTGVVERATDAETQTGTDTDRYISPANLSARTATETRTGVIEIATTGEAQTGTDDARALTPAKLQDVTATETRKGVIEIATQTEVNVGTDDTRAITPLKAATLRGLTTLTTSVGSGANTLSDDWDNYEEIVVVTSDTGATTTLQTHFTFYTDVILASDSTVTFNYRIGTTTFLDFNFRDTNRNEVYVDTGVIEVSADILGIYGRYKKV